MPRKQATINDSAAAAAPARAKAPRVKSAKHSKSSPLPETAGAELQSKLDPTLNIDAAEADSAEPVAVLEIIEEIVTSTVDASHQATPSTSPATATTNGVGRNEDPREEIARIAYGYWVARGYTGGDPAEDWVRAENEYNARRTA